eukprot:jgi/Astpho2/7713/Aster-x1443
MKRARLDAESTLEASTACDGDAQLDSSIDLELHLLQQELGFSLGTAAPPGSVAQAAESPRPFSAPAAPSGAAASLHEHSPASSTSAASSTKAPPVSVHAWAPRGPDVLLSSDGITSDDGSPDAHAGAPLPGNDRFSAQQLAAARRLVAESTTASQASVPRPPVHGPQATAEVNSEQQLLVTQEALQLSSEASEPGASAQRAGQQSLTLGPLTSLAGSAGHQQIAGGLQAEQEPASGGSATHADVRPQPAPGGMPAAQRQPDAVGREANGPGMAGSHQQPDAADEGGRGSGLAAGGTLQVPDARGSEAASVSGSEGPQLLYGACSGAASHSTEAASVAEPSKLSGQAGHVVQSSVGAGADSVAPSSGRVAAPAPSEAVQDLQTADVGKQVASAMDTLHRRPAEASSWHESNFAEPVGLGGDLLAETWESTSMPISHADFSAQAREALPVGRLADLVKQLQQAIDETNTMTSEAISGVRQHQEAAGLAPVAGGRDMLAWPDASADQRQEQPMSAGGIAAAGMSLGSDSVGSAPTLASSSIELDVPAAIPHLAPQMLAAQLGAVQLESIPEGSEEGDTSNWILHGVSSSTREEGGAATWDLPKVLAGIRDQREGGRSGIPDMSVSLSVTASPQPRPATSPPAQDEVVTLSTSLGISSAPAARDPTPTAGGASELVSGGDSQRVEEALSGPAAIAARYLPSDSSSILSQLTELAAQGRMLAAAAADGSSSSAALSDPALQTETIRSSITSTRLPSISSSGPAGAQQTLSAATTGAATEAQEGEGACGAQPQAGAGPDADRQQAVRLAVADVGAAPLEQQLGHASTNSLNLSKPASASHLLDWSMTSIESGVASASSLGWAGVPDVQEALEESDNGVTLSDLNGTFIDQQVEIAAGVHIGVGVQLQGKTRLLEGTRVEGPSVIINSEIGPNSLVRAFCHVEDSTHRGQGFGPFARLRAHSTVDKAYIGNFVEVKNSVIGPGSSLAHFAYSGDADIGGEVNVGAGTITCNYDGVNKHRTVISDNVMIGSNSTLVAPINIGEHAYVAAGSTLTSDVPAHDLAFGRARQVNKAQGASSLRARLAGQVTE